MDQTLLAVIVGSLTSILGGFLGHWFTMQREAKQWDRQQIAEREKRTIEARLANKQFLLNTYHNCINALSLLIAAEFDEEHVEVPDDKRLELYRNAYHWLSLVALQHRDNKDESVESQFHSEFSYFTERADAATARRLREQVNELAMRDRNLFPDTPVSRSENPNSRTVTIQIDDEFRKQQFLAGIELPETYTFTFCLEDLTPEQRRKIWDLFFDDNNVPRRFGGLPLPVYNKEKNKIVLRGRNWVAQINPFTHNPENIIRAWELDYEKALEVAQSEYEIQPEPP